MAYVGGGGEGEGGGCGYGYGRNPNLKFGWLGCGLVAVELCGVLMVVVAAVVMIVGVVNFNCLSVLNHDRSTRFCNNMVS